MEFMLIRLDGFALVGNLSKFYEKLYFHFFPHWLKGKAQASMLLTFVAVRWLIQYSSDCLTFPHVFLSFSVSKQEIGP